MKLVSRRSCSRWAMALFKRTSHSGKEPWRTATAASCPMVGMEFGAARLPVFSHTSDSTDSPLLERKPKARFIFSFATFFSSLASLLWLPLYACFFLKLGMVFLSDSLIHIIIFRCPLFVKSPTRKKTHIYYVLYIIYIYIYIVVSNDL